MKQNASRIRHGGLYASLASALVTGVFNPEIAFAQPQKAAMEEARAGGLADIVVTARKRAENLQSTPIAVTALDGQALKDHAIRRIDDLATLTPGLAIAQNQASPLGATFSLRAQVQNDLIVALDPPVAVYSDGVFLNTATGSLASSMVDIARVEVLKGPQGTLFGRNTTGGAVNFYTNEPVSRWEGELTAGAGNFDSYEVNGVLNAPLGGENALRIVGERSGHGGFGTNVVNGQEVGDIYRWSVRGGLKLVPIERLHILIRADLARAHSNGGPLSKALAVNPNTASPAGATTYSRGITAIAEQLGLISRTQTPNAAQIAAAVAAFNADRDLPRDQVAQNRPSYARVKAWGSSATIEYDLGDAQIKAISAYRKSHDVKAIDTDSTRFDLFTYGPATTDSRMFSQELQITGDTLANRLHYAVGGYYFWMKARDISTSWSGLLPQTFAGTDIQIPGSGYNARLKTRSKAAYAQATFDILPNLHFTGGLRYTDETRDMLVSAYASNFAATGLVCNLPAPLANLDLGTTIPTPETSICNTNNSVNYTNWSYTAGVDWNVTRDIMLYAKTSRGFKSGGINERQGTNPGTVRPFKPEILTDYEIGMKGEFLDRRLRVNVDYYHSVYNDIQRTVQFVDQATGRSGTVIDNAGKATVDGVELEVTAAPVAGLELQGTLAYTKPKYIRYTGTIQTPSGPAILDLSNQDFQQVSKWTYSLSAGYAAPTSFGTIRPQIDWAYKSRRNLFASGGLLEVNRQRGYGVLNGSLAITIEDIGVDARFWMKNVLNKYYIQQMFDIYNGNGFIAGFPGDPRTYGLSVTKRF